VAKAKAPSELQRIVKKKRTKGRKTRPDGYKRTKPRK
jgi:hypothetical protein